MKKNDLIIFIGIVIIALAAFLFINLSREKMPDADEQVLIRHNGEIIKTYDFTPYTDEVFTYENDGEKNVVVIKEGGVSMSEANCHDQICVKTHTISQVGEIIVCLPHKFTVEIVSKTSSAEIDGFSE